MSDQSTRAATRSKDPSRSFIVNAGMGLWMSDAGISPANVLRRAGLAGDLFSKGPTGLTPDEYFRMWEALDEEAQDPLLPLRFAEVISLEAFDPPIFAAVCSPNLNVAAHRIARYKRLIGPMRLSVVQTRTKTTLEYVWPDDLTPPPLLAAGEIIFWVALVRMTTRTRVRPLAITTPTPPSPASACGCCGSRCWPSPWSDACC